MLDVVAIVTAGRSQACAAAMTRQDGLWRMQSRLGDWRLKIEDANSGSYRKVESSGGCPVSRAVYLRYGVGNQYWWDG